MTYNNRNTGTLTVAKCPYFQPTGHNISEVGYITLPSNVSELNNYVCGPMNRKGTLCSEYIDDFGLSAPLFLYTCSNCTHFSLTYGIPLYVLIEVIPITVLYLIFDIKSNDLFISLQPFGDECNYHRLRSTS